ELLTIEKQLATAQQEYVDQISEMSNNPDITLTELNNVKRDYNKKILPITRRIEAIKAQRRVVNGTAITDSLIKFTQLKMLGWSPTTAAANLTFGMLTAYSHASMGIDYNEKQYWSATKIMLNATRRAVRLG